ncbi:MAG: hypothetical protein FIB04_05220 [Gammaproteobacteria bacterium]|nr:hypothetical protein [Gammaproteobacteria bacterium]
MSGLAAHPHAIAVTSLIVIGTLALGLHLFPYQTATGELGPRQVFSGRGHEALVADGLSLQAVLAAVMIFLGLRTNFVSNSAAAAIGMPVALSIAMPRGAYVFRDFVRVGGPLVVLMIVAFSIALARAYPARDVRRRLRGILFRARVIRTMRLRA